MKQFIIILIALSLSFFASSVYPADRESFQFKKQTELQQIKTEKPVRIKLKRTTKDKYTWELTGDNADEIIKIDRQLRKMLNVK